ncbi:MAG: hypothetical protein IKC69_03250 [Clostridia bacterium]|nr:hypothetical protein [Clostridia bacterium]
MCNIAGYLGPKNAAPILLEMLRRQAPYDGDMSTGVATIHEGKLYYRKIVGDVDTLIRETDVLDLPGTVGIAHTRPSGKKDEPAAHPFLNMEETMAVVTNGTTPRTQYCHLWDEAVDLLQKEGYTFRCESKKPSEKSPRLSSNGHNVSPAEARVLLIDLYLKKGKSVTEAMALACSHMVSDNVTVMINESIPDRIHVCRTTRPMTLVQHGDETYLATTRFGLPEELREDAVDLPLHHPCVITRDGYTVSQDKMQVEKVSEMTPYTYYEGYRRMEALLKSERAPLYFDELEFAVRDDMRDLWEGDHTYLQHARLVYDLLYQFDREGRLKREMRIQETKNGPRHRYYMWLED